MADVRDAMGDLWFVIFILIGLGILWFATGGPERSQNEGPFLSPPPPLGSGGSYGDKGGFLSFLQGVGGDSSGSGSGSETSSTNNSPLKGRVEIEREGGAATRPNEEYLTLRNIGTSAVDITGWRVKSASSNQEATIGEAARLPYSAQVNPQAHAVLQPFDSAIIVTGSSPIGTSFRTNRCTGYFEQYQDFTPSLFSSCPAPSEMLARSNSSLTELCQTSVQNLQQCEMVNAPAGAPESCHTFITEKLNYNNCVALFKNDSDFYGSEWRLFLGKNTELWKSQFEVIELLDQNGKIVDTLSY